MRAIDRAGKFGAVRAKPARETRAAALDWRENVFFFADEVFPRKTQNKSAVWID
jgi:hypothetical protein